MEYTSNKDFVLDSFYNAGKLIATTAPNWQSASRNGGIIGEINLNATVKNGYTRNIIDYYLAQSTVGYAIGYTGAKATSKSKVFFDKEVYINNPPLEGRLAPSQIVGNLAGVSLGISGKDSKQIVDTLFNTKTYDQWLSVTVDNEFRYPQLRPFFDHENSEIRERSLNSVTPGYNFDLSNDASLDEINIDESGIENTKTNLNITSNAFEYSILNSKNLSLNINPVFVSSVPKTFELYKVDSKTGIKNLLSSSIIEIDSLEFNVKNEYSIRVYAENKAISKYYPLNIYLKSTEKSLIKMVENGLTHDESSIEKLFKSGLYKLPDEFYSSGHLNYKFESSQYSTMLIESLVESIDGEVLRPELYDSKTGKWDLVVGHLNILIY